RRAVTDPTKPISVDIVVPLYNEERSVESFHRSLMQVRESLAFPVTIYYVDDGSRDGTGAILAKIAEADHGVRVIELSRKLRTSSRLERRARRRPGRPDDHHRRRWPTSSGADSRDAPAGPERL